jgi:ribonuclease BN (tRNA processing enzyme)
MSPPHFPIRPDGLRGNWAFHAMQPGVHELEGYRVVATEVQHKGGVTFGFRVDGPHGSLAYVPDHSPRLAPAAMRDRAVELVRDVDVLLHGGGYVADEVALADLYGHSTVDDAIELGVDAGVGRLVLVHHAPNRSDDEVTAIEHEVQHRRLPFPIAAGREGRWIAVERARDPFVHSHDSD